MNSKIDIYSEAWCNIVFESKNKSYGAFEMREKSGKRHLRALIIASVCFVLAITGPLIIKKIIPKKKEAVVDVTVMTDIKVDKNDKKENEIKEEIKMPEESLKETIKYVAVVVKPDAEVPEDEVLINQDALSQTSAAISIKDQKGSVDGTVDPADFQEEAAPSIVEDDTPPVQYVENMPDFPGGDAARMKFLNENVKYPQLARETGVEGVVYVEFIVERNGKITNVKLKRGIGGGCDEEAIRIVKMMPNWNPGRQNGQNVRVQFVLPFNFKLH